MIHNLKKMQRKIDAAKEVIITSSSSSNSEDKDEMNDVIIPDLEIGQWNVLPEKEQWTRKHTGFAFSGEAGHVPQITDPDYYK